MPRKPWERLLETGSCELTRISHQLSTAAADPGMPTALRSLGLLRRTVEYACGALGRAPCIHARLRRLATKPGEKSGLMRALKTAPVFSTICGTQNDDSVPN